MSILSRSMVPTGETSASASASSVPSSSQDGNSDVPIAVIVGATVAGMVLAVAIMVAWVLCSRAVKRRQVQQSRKEEWLAATKTNTERNAVRKPSIHNHLRVPPPLARHSSGRVTFSARDGERLIKEKDEGLTRNIPEPSRPKPLRSTRSLENDGQSEGLNGKAVLEKVIIHQPSTVSSASWYSTESGEERQTRPPASFIRAAFSRMGRGVVDAAMKRDSEYSNLGDQSRQWQEEAMNRASQATSVSAYSEPEGGIGIAR